MGLSKTQLLVVELSSMCSRERYTTDPAPVIEQLRKRAGNRADVLAHAVGIWAGYFRGEHTATLCDALEQIDGTAEWVEVGRKRRGAGPHSAPLTDRQ